MDKLRNDERMLIYKLLYDNALKSMITELKTKTKGLIDVDVNEKNYYRHVRITKCISCKYCWTRYDITGSINTKKCGRCIMGSPLHLYSINT